MKHPFLLGLLLLAGCTGVSARGDEFGSNTLPDGVETQSLFGEWLYPPPLTEKAEARAMRNYADAQLRQMREPDSADALIWLGRRTAYLGYFGRAVDIYSSGVARFPKDSRFLRHRGHRLITLRRFEQAELDFESAVQLFVEQPDRVEPDGQPNDSGIPLTSLKTNVYYHLGLARYLQGDFEGAIEAYEKYRRYNDNDDGLCSIVYWHYLALRQLGRDSEARSVLEPIREDFELLENFAYHRMLLVFRCERGASEILDDAEGVESATMGYGLGIWYVLEGNRERGIALLRESASSETWHAFGRIASEAELRRLGAEL